MLFSNEKVNYGQYEVPNKEECINLAVGQPRNDLLLLKEFNLGLSRISKNLNFSLLQYGNISGYQEFRSVLADFLSCQYSKPIDYNNLIISSGITGSLSLLLSLFSNSKTKIICEDPTYFLALNIFKDFGFDSEQIIKIPTDEQGICVQNLFNLKMDTKYNYIIYLIPYNQNPTGYSISKSRLDKLDEFLNLNTNCKVFSDEVYNLLNFDSVAGEPLYLRNKNIISLGSFSKIFAPALRLGWISASSEICSIIKSCGQLDSSGCVNPLSCAIMHELILDGTLQKSISHWKSILQDNSERLYSLVKTELSEYIVKMEKPTGGYFMWIKFNRDMEFLSNFMAEYKIKFHHGKKFSSMPDANQYARFSFCWYMVSDYELFVFRLKSLLESNLDKTQVYILGHGGKLGKLITQSVKLNSQLYFAGGLGHHIDLSTIRLMCKNIIIDVSSPLGTSNLITKLLENKMFIPLIIGTTGELPLELIKTYSLTAPVYLCPNFSMGISQFKKIIDSIDKSKWTARIVEKHHIHKKDSPSGTSKILASKYLGKSDYSDLDIISIREGETYGYHELILEAENETIVISHNAKTRNLFADGCVDLILDIVKNIPTCGLYSR